MSADLPSFEKLIRDRIPAIIAAERHDAAIRQVSDDEVLPYLHRKVLEEAGELYLALRAGDRAEVTLELADMLEVMHRVAEAAHLPWDDVLAERLRRREARGGFTANYLLAQAPEQAYRVFGGDRPPLGDELKRQLARCRRASIAVSFGMRTGIALLQGDMHQALARGAQLRILTSDYLDITEPEALEELLAVRRNAPGDLQVKLYHEPGRSFHAKCYVFEHHDGRHEALIGSSNLSGSALQDGIEWNYLVRETDDGWSINDLLRRFDALFASPYAAPVDQALIDAYRDRRVPRPWTSDDGAGAPDRPKPNAPQREALAELLALRAQGERKALVIAATGVGKTYLAAFDAQPFARVLFLAHRDELLTQAHQSFARVRPDATLGFYDATRRDTGADVLFASVATLGRAEHLARFTPDHFDYVVVDEFHHAAAPSYRAILHYFAPRFLLGLTATPYRGDNRDVFALCDGNVAYRVSFMEAIALGWLAPFKYFGVHDATDYAAVPWRSGRYDAQALEHAVETRERAGAVLARFQEHAAQATIGFCVSISHAEFMATFFREHGVPALAVHSGPGAPDRADALARLRQGELRVLFTVDLFNEGVDVPEIDMVLFLRPTESVTVFLQQLGRGLRLSPGKAHLTVLDFIGNYKRAHYKVPLILGQLDDEPDPTTLRAALAAYRAGTIALPPGVEVRFDDLTQALFDRMVAEKEPRRLRLVAAFEEVRAELGRRPTLLELQRQGRYDVRTYRQEFGPWFRFLAAQGLLTPSEQALEDACGPFLAMLETTAMTKIFKMVVLAAFVRLGGLHAPVPIADLVTAFRAFFAASLRHQAELGPEVRDLAATSDDALRAYVMRNPIAAWCQPGSKQEPSAFFAHHAEADVLAYLGPTPADPAAFDAAALERAEFRLATHFEARYKPPEFRVINAGPDRGIIMLGDDARARAPRGQGWLPVQMNGKTLWANFVQIAINVVRATPPDQGDAPNVLTAELETMFGPRGWLPEHGNHVRITPADAEQRRWLIEPIRPSASPRAHSQ